MNTLQIEVGQTVVVCEPNNKPRRLTVAKVGRKLVTLSNGTKARLDTYDGRWARIESAMGGQMWPSVEAFEAAELRDKHTNALLDILGWAKNRRLSNEQVAAMHAIAFPGTTT